MKKLTKKVMNAQHKVDVAFVEVNKSLVEKFGPKPELVEDQELNDQLEFLGLINNQIQDNNKVIQQVTQQLSKADVARQIWAEELAKVNEGEFPVRKTTISRLKSDPLFSQNGIVPLTQNGAATYYQNMKKKAGFVQETA